MPKIATTRKTYRRRAYRKKGFKKPALAKAVKRAIYKSKPKREIRFFFDNDLETVTAGLNFGYNTITNITQGDQFNQRDGRRIYMSGLRLSLALQNNSTLKTRYVRVLVVRSKNAQGTTLNLANMNNLLKQETFSTMALTKTSADVIYPVNTTLLQVYYDRTYRIKPEAQSSTLVQRYVSIKKNMLYDSLGSGNVPTTGEVYVIVLIAEGDDTPSDVTVTCRGMVRVFYKDA